MTGPPTRACVEPRADPQRPLRVGGTTAAGFGMLVVSSIVPIRQFGIITALTIAYSIIAAVLILPAILHPPWGSSGAAR